MQLEGAVVGGEGNGGVILPALQHTRDAPLAVALILQHLADEGVTLSEAAGKWPGYTIVKEKVTFPRETLREGYAALENDLGAESKDESDGLRLAWPKRKTWLHVRPSGTEPVVRLIAEAPDGEPLIGIFRVYSADSTALPEDFAVEAAWLVDGTEIWATYFTGEEPPESEQQPYLWYEVARRGPKWGPGITVDAVVRIRNADGVAYLLRAPGQQIWRTD
jgi:hypothetical protein